MPQRPEQKFSIKLNRTLVLIGLMGAGKTSVGRRLASFLDVPFRDSDHEIEAAAGMNVRDIFERFGEADFRAGERKVVSRLLGSAPCVLATGGGAFMQDAVRAEVAQKGLSVWLDADLDTLWERVKDKPTRPLLQQPDPYGTLQNLLETRTPIYSEADVRVTSEKGIAHDLMVRRILEAVHAHDRDQTDRTPTLSRGLADAG